MKSEFDDTHEVEFSALEYVIYLGAQGNHILFEKDRIREAFARRDKDLTDLDSEVVVQVREAIGEVFAIPDLEGKKEYIASLPPEVHYINIHLYFQMVEKSMLLERHYH